MGGIKISSKIWSKPKKFLGQVFLRDKNIRTKILNLCNFEVTDTVLEIGAGKGELTELIVKEVKELVALELDSDLFKFLQENLDNFPNLTLLNKDILKFDIARYFGSKKIKVIGNIPYYITTPIIEHLLKYRENIKEIFLTTQKEVAERIIANPGGKTYGALSCFVQYYTEPKILLKIKKSCFSPMPKVDSSFLRLSIREKPLIQVEDEELLFKIIKLSFQKRRKTLKNALIEIIPSEKIDNFFKIRRLSPKIRAEEVGLEDFVFLTRLVANHID